MQVGGSLHGAVWNLHWRDGETFELEEKPVVTVDTIEADLIAAVTAEPGASWAKTRDRITGNDKDKAKVRDRLLADGTIVNVPARAGQFNLYLPEHPEATRASASTGLARLTDAPQDGAPDQCRATVPDVVGTGGWHGHGGQGSQSSPERLDDYYESIAAEMDASGELPL